MHWTLQLALRQLFPPGRVFPAFAGISILGVGLGVAALLVVQTVMNGFGEEHRLRIRESYGDIRVFSATPLERPEELAEAVAQDPEVIASTPYAEGPALIRANDYSSIAFVRGVISTDKSLPARRYVTDGTLEGLDDGRVVLGAGLARQLRVRVGDKVDLWSPSLAEQAERGRAPLPAEMEVCAILRTGFTEIDDRAALIPLRRFSELWALGDRAHGIIIRIKNPADAEVVAARLEAKNPVGRYIPWQAEKRNLLEAIRFEKTMLFFLMFIITLVASFSIGSTLFSSVIRRSREIGVLAALGARPAAITTVFTTQGFLIGLLGTLFGFGLTFLILGGRDLILSTINALFGDGDMVGQMYQFSAVPLHYDSADFVTAAVFTLLTTSFAGLVPALWAARRRPTEAMRDV